MKHNIKERQRIVVWLLKNSGKSKYGILALSLCCAALSVSTIVSALIFKYVVDGAVQGSRGRFVQWLCAYVGILLLQTALSGGIYHLEETAGFALESSLRRNLYEKLLRMDYGELKNYRTGELMNYLNGDVDIVAGNMISVFPGLIEMTVKLLGAMGVLVVWDWRFGVVFLAGGTAMIFVTSLLRRRMRQLHKNVRTSYDEVYAFQQESVANMIMVRSFRAQKRAGERLWQHLGDAKKARLKRSVFSNFSYICLDLVMNGGYLLGLIWCAVGIFRGRITYGTLAAVLQLITQVQQPFANITAYLPKYYAMCASAERLMNLENTADEGGLEAGAEEGGKEYAMQELYEEMDAVCVENLCFSYEKIPILSEAALTIRKGDFMAFTGASGIGKSTLLKLLLALYPPEKGRIFVRKCDGGSVTVTPTQRGLFAYVPQGNYLMSGTIYETVGFLREHGSFSEQEKEKVREACEIACAQEFIEALPQRYDTVIGEHGAGLSEGQIQRLAIARAVFSGAPVLLLDEATSALDEPTEKLLLENLKKLTDRTVLIVTHRKMALGICNRIIEIVDGRFTEKEQRDGRI